MTSSHNKLSRSATIFSASRPRDLNAVSSSSKAFCIRLPLEREHSATFGVDDVQKSFAGKIHE